MLHIDNLTLALGPNRLHYQRSIAPGTTVTLQGLSGVGKSSLLLSIAGFHQPVSGDIRWQGQSLLSLDIEERPVAMLFQEHNLFEHLSVSDNLRLGLAGTTAETIHDAARQLGVLDQLEKMPPQLSGGQRQRIALARTLMRPEPIILLDEPFAELDAKSRETAAQWVAQTAKRQGKTLLLVTHQQEDVARLADENWQL
ncbi:MAG: ATP-binding cassette domain-containing protein [Pseudomonadales bacterium]